MAETRIPNFHLQGIGSTDTASFCLEYVFATSFVLQLKMPQILSYFYDRKYILCLMSLQNASYIKSFRKYLLNKWIIDRLQNV